jgi:O-antigen/teichoic acid export membrane protein
MSNRRLFNNSAFSLSAKLVSAGIQLVSLPILIGIYGTSDYGLIAIALSLNTFAAIMQLGLPTAIPKFVAEWLAKGEGDNLQAAMRSIAGFYLVIACLNCIVLLAIALFGVDFFNVTPDGIEMLRNLLFITAATSLFAIPASVIDQMLTGAQELAFVSRLQMGVNVMTGALVTFAYLNPTSLSITQFYGLRCLLMFLPVPFSLMRWRRYGNLGVFIPGWDLDAVRPILKYSLTIFVFGVFIIISQRFTPIILAMQVSHDAGSEMTYFRIIDSFNIFLTMISGSIMAALVPHLAGSVAKGDEDILRKSIVHGTKVIWSFGALIGFGMIMLAGEGLSVYVGSEYHHLEGWLKLYLLTSLYYLYHGAIGSAILSSEKLAPLGWATGLGCIVSLALCWFFAPSQGVGGVVIGFAGYVSVHFMVVNFWYLPKYFKIDPVRQIFQILLPPVLAGIVMYFVGRWLISYIGSLNHWLNIGIGAVSGTLVYGALILGFYIKPRELRGWISKVR